VSAYKEIPPPTSILMDSFPISVYRVLRLHKPPPARLIDLCCGPSSWTLWIEKVGGYDVCRCDVSREARLNVRADFKSSPFNDNSFDGVMADLPYPFYHGDRYGGLKTFSEYLSLLEQVGHTGLRLLRSDGVLLLKTADFWNKGEMYSGVWAVYSVLKENFVCKDLAVTVLKPFVFSPGQFQKCLRTHNYLMVFRPRAPP